MTHAVIAMHSFFSRRILTECDSDKSDENLVTVTICENICVLCRNGTNKQTNVREVTNVCTSSSRLWINVIRTCTRSLTASDKFYSRDYWLINLIYWFNTLNQQHTIQIKISILVCQVNRQNSDNSKLLKKVVHPCISCICSCLALQPI